MKMRIQNGSIPLLGLIIILAVTIIAAGSIYYVSRTEKESNTNLATINSNGAVNANRNTRGNATMDANGNASSNTNVVSNTNGNRNTNSSINSNANTFTSTKLGIQFTHATSDSGHQIMVKESENRIYVYRDDMTAEAGQYVEMFTKDAGTSLQAAIEQRFLSGYSSSDCFVQSTTVNNLSSSWSTAVISFPPADTTSGDPWWANAEACPSVYTTTNGISYFASSSEAPTKYYFFNIGQYSILSATPNVGWQRTVEVMK